MLRHPASLPLNKVQQLLLGTTITCMGRNHKAVKFMVGDLGCDVCECVMHTVRFGRVF
jgi:hypothetical protein